MANPPFSQRSQRYSSHALVEVRPFRWIPIGMRSAVLLDISLHGFKIEMTKEYRATAGEKYWICIPLAPLGIVFPTKLICQAQCRWFEEERCRMGGVFLKLNRSQSLIITQIIQTLQDKSQAI